MVNNIDEHNHLCSCHGFTLIEVLIAMSILALVVASMTSGFTNNARLNTRSELKTEAIQVAQIILDELRLEQMSALATSGELNYSHTLNNREYLVTVTLCQNALYCPPNTTNSTRHLYVQVEYNDSVVYEIQTIYTDLI